MEVKPHSNLIRLLRYTLLAVLIISPLTIRAAGQAPRYPFRLRLKVQANTARAGERIPLTVEFLDRDYQPVVNDRDRVISFKGTAITPGASGEVQPNPLPVRARAMSSQAVFQGKGSGKLSIRAESEGLQPYEMVLSVKGTSISLLSRLLDFTVHAQDKEPDANSVLPFRFYPSPKDFPQAPANGKSPVTFQVGLEDSATEKLRVRIETTPGCPVIYRELPQASVFDVNLDPKDDLSGEIRLTSSQPGDCKVEAYVPGRRDRSISASARFGPPMPASIILDLKPEEVTSEKATALLTVRLADEAGTPIMKLGEAHKIEVSASDHQELMGLSKRSLLLSSDRPVEESKVELKGFPDNKQLSLLALDREAALTATKTIKFSGMLPGAAPIVLLVLAGFGGMLGGLTRYVFKKSRSEPFFPRHINGRLRLGFMGSLPFSALFGAALFLAIRLGETGVVGKVALDNLSRSDSMIFACFFGVLGGFAGITVLDRLVQRFVPRQQARRAAHT